MCLIAWADRAHPGLPWVLIANRDEFHARPSLAADWRAGAPQFLAGIDQQAGGCWLAYQPGGRMAAVTNFRKPPLRSDWRFSRGQLVKDWMALAQHWPHFAERASAEAPDTGSYNLLLRDRDGLRHCANHPQWQGNSVAPGVHGLSNASLDTPWPKLLRVKAGLARWLGVAGDTLVAADSIDLLSLSPLFELMRDAAPAEDDALPDTGIGQEWERLLSSPFIEGEAYGTRCTTVIIEWSDGRWLFVERRFAAGGRLLGEACFDGRC